METIRTVTRTARKRHECNACLWLRECLYDVVDDMTFAEKRQVVKARHDGWRILPGQTYVEATIKEDGEIRTTRFRKEIDDICVRHDLYPRF